MNTTRSSEHRLPSDVLPSHYDITLEPDLDAATFTGAVAIAITLSHACSEILLNVVDLDIAEAWLARTADARADARIDGIAVSYTRELERAALRLPMELPAGSYSLNMKFSGALNNRLLGFYRSRFIDASGAERMLAVTQMQGTNARRVFPCFDEPCFKATFAVTLIIPSSLDAVSNAPIVDLQRYAGNKKLIRFDRTIAMPPYLLAVVVGPLASSAAVDVDGVALRTLYVGERGRLTGFSLEMAGFALRFYTRRYGLAYPGKKLDQVAVPDFAAAGMENFGCITYREVVVLVDRDTASTSELIRSADVIAHEVAHMWFGDLVTMDWWNGLWLNEAFATFMGMCCVESYNAAWHRWAQFAVERSKAFEVDSLESTCPIEYPVESPLQALGMLNVLTYRKGASLLRMLEQFVGSERFFEGVSRYLRRHAYANATGDDLWAAIESATQQPIARVMRSWVLQKGYPMVTVSLGADRRRLTVTQKLFRFASPGPGENTKFIVPLQFRAYESNGATREHRLLLEEASADVDLGAPVDGVVMNAGGHGFYRVRYELSMLRSLLASGRAWGLCAEERYMLVDDCWATVLEGSTTVVEFLELVASMNDIGLNEWILLATALEAIGRIVGGDAAAGYQARVCELATVTLRRLGWDPAEAESTEARELRGVVVRVLGTTGGAHEVIAKSRRLYESYLSEPCSVEPNLAAAVTAIVARNGDDDDYEVFVRRSVDAATPQQALRYHRALGDFPGKQHMERTLGMCLNGAIRSQDAPMVLSSCLSNRDQGIVAWKFVKENWEHISRTYSPIAIVPCLASVTFLDQPDVADDVVSFFGTRKVPQAQMLLQHLERLRVNVAFRQREHHRLTHALSPHAASRVPSMRVAYEA